MNELPSGTVTFLFTDIEGSTRLWEKPPDEMRVALAQHDSILRETAELIREHLPSDVILQDLGEHRLKDLVCAEHLYQLTTVDLQQTFPPIKTLNEFQNNLPAQLTSFVDREQIRELLKSARLITLTSSGGTRKTRLVIECGGEAMTQFPHGVWLVELVSLTDGLFQPWEKAIELALGTV